MAFGTVVSFGLPSFPSPGLRACASSPLFLNSLGTLFWYLTY